MCLLYPAWFTMDGPRHIVGAAFPGTPEDGVTTSGLVSARPLHPPRFPLESTRWIFRQRGTRRIVCWRSGADISCYFSPCVGQQPAGVGLGCGRLFVMAVHSGRHKQIDTPWRIFEHVPVVSRSDHERFTAVTDLAIALLLALSADRWWSALVQHFKRRDVQLPSSRGARSLKISGALLSAVTAATLIPLGAAYSFPFVIREKPVPPWFVHVAPRLVQGTVVLTYPYPDSLEQQAMAWQAIDGLRFRIIGGWAIVPGRDGRHSASVSPFGGAISVLEALSEEGGSPLPSATAHTVRLVRRSLHDWGAQVVVVPMADEGRDPAYAAGFLTAVLGRLPRIQARAWVWYGLGDHSPMSISRRALFACTSVMAMEEVSRCVLDSSEQGTPQQRNGDRNLRHSKM